jgi:hypothetical protein
LAYRQIPRAVLAALAALERQHPRAARNHRRFASLVAHVPPLGAVRGWVGFVGSRENSLKTAVHPSDHLESLLFVIHKS